MQAKRIEGNLYYIGLPWVVQMVKNLPAMQETKVRSLGLKDPLATFLEAPARFQPCRPLEPPDWWLGRVGAGEP